MIQVEHNTPLTIVTQFKVGSVIKFKITTNSGDLIRYSYSKITKIIPKITEDLTVDLNYLTENEKFVPQTNIISIERQV